MKAQKMYACFRIKANKITFPNQSTLFGGYFTSVNLHILPIRSEIGGGSRFFNTVGNLCECRGCVQSRSFEFSDSPERTHRCSPCRSLDLSACQHALSSAQSGQSCPAVVEQHHCSVGRSYGGTARSEREQSGGKILDLGDRSGLTPPLLPLHDHRVTLSQPARVGVSIFITWWLVKQS